jgi:hypothetical protein
VSFFFLLNKSLIKRIVIPTVTVFSSFFCGLSTCSVLIWLLVWFAFLPCANASQPTTPFPEIKFSVFNQFISSTFNSNISLATVLMVFFTLIENPELLNLHARQKNPQLSSENSIISSAWMRALCRQMKDHLPDNGFVRLFKKNEFTSETWEDDLSKKLDGFAECLGLTPYRNGLFHKKLLPISQKSIQPEYIICPLDMECTKSGCHGRHIFMSTKKSDIPIVTLIQYFTVPPHSIWNPYGIHGIHGIHMESIWNMFVPWNPHGFHGFHEFHMDSMDSTWTQWNLFNFIY